MRAHRIIAASPPPTDAPIVLGKAKVPTPAAAAPPPPPAILVLLPVTVTVPVGDVIDDALTVNDALESFDAVPEGVVVDVCVTVDVDETVTDVVCDALDPVDGVSEFVCDALGDALGVGAVVWLCDTDGLGVALGVALCVAVGVALGVALGLMHAGGRSGQSTAASAIKSQKAPAAAVGGTMSAEAMNCVDVMYNQHTTPAVLARTAHANPAPISTATTSPCSPAGSVDTSEGSPQHVMKPDTFTAHARHWPAAIDTVVPCTLAGGDWIFEAHFDADHQHVTDPAGNPAIRAHVPVDRAASARTLVPVASAVGTVASVSPDVVLQDTAPAVDRTHAWYHPATTAAAVPVGSGLAGGA